MASKIKVRLREVATLQLGITFRGADAARHDPDGSHQLIRIGDLSEDGEIRAEAAPLVAVREMSTGRGELNPGDVILASRGTRMTAALFDGSFPAVVGSQFCVIRADPERMIPTYLWWFLNLPHTQECLLSQARGSYVRSLSLGALGDLEVLVPAIGRQRVISKIHELRLREKSLTAQLARLRAILVDQELLRAAHANQ